MLDEVKIVTGVSGGSFTALGYGLYGENCSIIYVRVRRYKTNRGRGGKIFDMKVATGIVVDGKVVVDGEALTEGSTVTVVLREDEEAFELTPEEEEELLESIAEIERGEFVSGEQVLERLRRAG